MRLIERKCLVYSNRAENSNKFYIMEVIENNGKVKLITKYGKLGKKPRITEKEISSERLAISEMHNTCYKKKNKSNTPYIEADIEDIISNGDDWWN